jgi:RecA-family ATPase
MNQPDIIPPHSIEAERALVGCALFDPDSIATLTVKRQDFYNAKLGAIWAAVRALQKEGIGIDFVTLPELLKARGVEANIIELMELQGEVPTAVNAPDYARIVKAHSRQRRLINLSGAVASEAYAGKQPDPQTLETLKRVYEGDDEAAKQWRIRTIGDAYEERPPTNYLIDGIVPKPSVNVWFGPPGSNKTNVLIDLSMCAVAGAEWLPGSPITYKAKRSSVLWIDTDNGKDIMHERIAAFAKARSLKPEDPFYYITMPDPWIFMSDINSQMDLTATIDRLGIDLVVIDNLGNITGDIDENSAAMVRIMSPLRQIADQTDTAIIVIHHQRKGGANGSRAGDALRGHSVIEASLDFAVLVVTDEETKLTTIKCTKARRFRFEDIKAKMTVEHKGMSKDMELAWWTVPVPKRGDNPVRDAIIDVLNKNGKMTQERLLDATYDHLDHKYGKAKIRSWIKEMTDITNELVIEKGPYNANLLSLK